MGRRVVWPAHSRRDFFLGRVRSFLLVVTPESPTERPLDHFPSTTVVLCLRGADPFLQECLQGLLTQDYPDYRVTIVIDHPDDAARAVVESTLQRLSGRPVSPGSVDVPGGVGRGLHSGCDGNLIDVSGWSVMAGSAGGASQPGTATPHAQVRVEFLEDWKTTCSRKCSSLLQAMRSLHPSCQVVALLDADVVPHASWLRQLVAPLASDSIGGATGHRWFTPISNRPGTWIRAQWNTAAVMLMAGTGLAWGGSLAFKTELLRQTNVQDLWSRALCEDVLIADKLRSIGLQCALVPDLFMLNREDCSTGQFFMWAQRQTILARLYNRYPQIFNMLLSAAFHFLYVGSLVAVFVLRSWGARMGWQAGGLGLVGFLALNVTALSMAEVAVRSQLRRSGRPIDQPALWQILCWYLAIPLTCVLSAAIWTSAQFRRSVCWRGIRYRYAGPWQVQVVDGDGNM